MVSSPLMLLLLPAIAVAVPMLLWEPSSWRQAVLRLGLIGLCLSAWVDIVDNAVGQVEHDPPLLSVAWGLSIALVAIGRLATVLRP